jgi:hypothetical protein
MVEGLSIAGHCPVQWNDRRQSKHRCGVGMSAGKTMMVKLLHCIGYFHCPYLWNFTTSRSDNQSEGATKGTLVEGATMGAQVEGATTGALVEGATTGAPACTNSLPSHNIRSRSYGKKTTCNDYKVRRFLHSRPPRKPGGRFLRPTKPPKVSEPSTSLRRSSLCPRRMCSPANPP